METDDLTLCAKGLREKRMSLLLHGRYPGRRFRRVIGKEASIAQLIFVSGVSLLCRARLLSAKLPDMRFHSIHSGL
ncbi:hypothetical protein D3C85_1423930 [compost metagenome]